MKADPSVGLFITVVPNVVSIPSFPADPKNSTSLWVVSKNLRRRQPSRFKISNNLLWSNISHSGMSSQSGFPALLSVTKGNRKVTATKTVASLQQVITILLATHFKSTPDPPCKRKSLNHQP